MHGIKTRMEGLNKGYHPLRLVFANSGETIRLSSAVYKGDALQCVSDGILERLYPGLTDNLTLHHKNGTMRFKGYVTQTEFHGDGSCSFSVAIMGEISNTIHAIEILKNPDVSPIQITGGTFGGAELKIEYSNPEDDYKNLWSKMQDKPGLILDEVGTFTKENSMFKIGDKVIIVKMDDHYDQANSIDQRWFLEKEVLTITGVRGPGEYFDYTCVDKEDYKSHVVGSWLKHAGKQPKKLKYPENAITRAQALKLAKQLHPNVTHIAKSADASWYVYELVSGINNNSYKSNNYSPIIHIPIRYDGTWQDSIYPKVYFSSAVYFEGFEQHVTVLEDGSLKVGCNTVPGKAVDLIIAHRIAELKKFPGAKKKPVKKKAGKK